MKTTKVKNITLRLKLKFDSFWSNHDSKINHWGLFSDHFQKEHFLYNTFNLKTPQSKHFQKNLHLKHIQIISVNSYPIDSKSKFKSWTKAVEFTFLLFNDALTEKFNV